VVLPSPEQALMVQEMVQIALGFGGLEKSFALRQS
jgi:hypothetical protein